MATAVIPSIKEIVEQLEHGLGVDAATLAAAAQTTPRSLQRWVEGQTFPQRLSRQRINELSSLLDHLKATFTTTDAIHAWMHASNRYLGGLSPAEVARVGRIDRIENALEALDSGIFV